MAFDIIVVLLSDECPKVKNSASSPPSFVVAYADRMSMKGCMDVFPNKEKRGEGVFHLAGKNGKERVSWCQMKN